MPFVNDRETRTALDKDRNVSICGPHGLWSDTSPSVLTYKYASPDLTFYFWVISHEERRDFIRDGKKANWPVCVAIDVLERSIQRGIDQSQHRPSYPLSPERFNSVKEAVKEGIFALCVPHDIKDDSILVPDFKVNFVTHVDFTAANSFRAKQAQKIEQISAPEKKNGLPLDWKLDDDQKIATITLQTNPPVEVRLTVSEVEALAHNIGSIRQKMTPVVPQEFKGGGRVNAFKANWATHSEVMMGGSIVHIRDPRFGWLPYFFPREGAKKLGVALQNQADQLLPPAPKQMN